MRKIRGRRSILGIDTVDTVFSQTEYRMCVQNADCQMTGMPNSTGDQNAELRKNTLMVHYRVPSSETYEIVITFNRQSQQCIKCSDL